MDDGKGTYCKESCLKPEDIYVDYLVIIRIYTKQG